MPRLKCGSAEGSDRPTENYANIKREFQNTFVRKLETSKAGFGLLRRWTNVRKSGPLLLMMRIFQKRVKINL